MKKFLYIFTITLFSVVFLFPGKTFASELIKNYETTIIARSDGTMDITENITYDFGNENRHGIFRDIPITSKIGNLYRVIDVTIKEILRNGNPEKYSEEKNGEKISVKIGDSNKTITGTQIYKISYIVKNGVGSNYEDHDEIYWNTTGSDWKVIIEKASVNISTDFGVSPNKALCFTGKFGENTKNCDDSKLSTVSTNNSLSVGEGLTAVWNFPKDTFPDSILQTEVTSNNIDEETIGMIFLGYIILLNLIIPSVLLYYYFKHRRKERFGKPTVNFDFPEDAQKVRITPAEAGSIDSFRVDQNDIVATIFDLAIRKYIKIEQVKNEKVLGIFGSNEDYLITKLKEKEDLAEFENKLFYRLFSEGNSIKLSELNKDFYETFQQMEKSIFERLVERNFYKRNPKYQIGFLLAFGIISFFILAPVLAVVLLYLSRKLNGRTADGDLADWKLDGLKIFLKNMKRHHQFQAKSLITVEKYIPYAIAFGFINEFMDELKEIYPKYNPVWYSGNTSFYLATGHMLSSMNSSFTTTAPSSSSGFSGGGFSGGGGGGGGGGSW